MMRSHRWVCPLLFASFVGGCATPASPTATAVPTPVPPAVATPTSSAQAPSHTDEGSPTAAPTVGSIGHGAQTLDAGTYRLELPRAPTVLDPDFPTLHITVPEGWNSLDGWIIHRGAIATSTVAVRFWKVDQVYGHPCQWSGTLSRPGPTVDDLADTLADRPLRNATPPIDVTLDGYDGRYLEWSVPSDIDFSECDADGSTHYFESWTGPLGQSDRYQQAPGQVDRLWILDVDGSRLVIDAFDLPPATDAERAELVAIVESITFER